MRVEEGASMKQILAFGCSMVLALIVMDTHQVVKTPSGLTVIKGGHALAADLSASAVLRRLRPVARRSRKPPIGRAALLRCGAGADAAGIATGGDVAFRD